MSGYEEEHNIQSSSTAAATDGNSDTTQTHYRRPDLSTFFSNLTSLQADETASSFMTATPGDAAALFREYAQSLQLMMADYPGAFVEQSAGLPQGTAANPLLERMISVLMANADDPPRAVRGMPDTYFDELERVDHRRELNKDDSCPICANPFLEDKYPLVVRLPCHHDHVFDLDCIRPWLKVQTTCPMCRKDLEKKKEPPAEKKKPAAAEQDDEEEWDDMYA